VLQFAISVDATGARNFLNVIGSDLPASAQGCVKDVLDEVRFVAGPAATWRDRLNL